MFNHIKNPLDQVIPIEKVSVILPEEISSKYEKALSDSLTYTEAAKYALGKDKDRYYELSSKAKQDILAMQQFIVEKWAPNEYKKLTNPCSLQYSIELRKMTFTIAENETVEIRDKLLAIFIQGSAKALIERLGKEKTDER